MIDTYAVLSQAEQELRHTRNISPPTCQALENLPGETRAAVFRALTFLGCPSSETGVPSPQTTVEADRVAAARLMLMKLGMDTEDPRWSSDVLDRLLKSVIEAPDGSVDDLFSALVGVLGDYAPQLSMPLASLTRDLIVKCFTHYRQSYDLVNWGGLVERLVSNPTKASFTWRCTRSRRSSSRPLWRTPSPGLWKPRFFAMRL